jgi:hypothetical protein
LRIDGFRIQGTTAKSQLSAAFGVTPSELRRTRK